MASSVQTTTVPPAATKSQLASGRVEEPAVDRVKANELVELDIANRLGAPDVYVDSEEESCWYHWVGDLWVKPLRFNNRNGEFVIKLRSDVFTELGKHRHRGEVKAYSASGNWGYHEYKWKAKPGDYITENPGAIHTLWMGGGGEVLFDVMGSIEFFNEDNTLREIMDGFSFWRMYVDHCEKEGIKPNHALWY